MTAAESATPTESKTPLYSAGMSSLRLSIVLGWVRALLGAGAAVAIGNVVDGVVSGQPFGPSLALVVSLLVVRSLISSLMPVAAATTSARVATDLRGRALAAVLKIGPWSGRRTGDTVTKATEGIDAVGALAGTFLPQLVTGMSIPILLAGIVATIDLATALVLVLVLPLIPLLLRLLEKRFASVSARYRATADQLAARFLDGIQGIRTLKALDRADAYGEQIALEAERLRTETMRLLRVNQLALLAVDTLFTVGTVVAASLMAATRLMDGVITIGQAIAIVLLGVMLIEPLSQIGRFFYVGAIGRASAAEVKSLIAEANRLEEPTPPAGDFREGSIEFEDVSFAYPDGTEGVREITFTIEPGERVALVGPSGAGKTTIAHLLLGLLHPDSGSVRLGGVPVLVPQRPYLFYGTIRENLSIGKPESGEAELWAALEAVGMATMVQQRPGGLDAQIGERGLQLSGGEAQRLAVARALVVDAPVVVLDEPTSNVDLESEARMRDAIGRLTESRTVLIIAHRRSTISGVERVIFVANGQLEGVVSGAEAGRRLQRSDGIEQWQ
jgi:ABC-type transport system involved in cytochrome bd biosynthesis fused ATPase/permease subunit